MIQTIEQATQTRILIGQNGIVVVMGRNLDGIKLSTRAIKMVEEEAHTANLTQRVKALLNVPDSPQAESSSVTQTQNNQKGEEIQSTIEEVEEEKIEGGNA
jgi:exosome complex component RRP4